MSQSAGSSLALRNPHSVLAALQTRPDDVLRVALPPSGGQRGATEAAGDAWEQVAKLARQHKIQVQTASPAAAAGDSRGRDKDRDGGRVSGAHAVVRERGVHRRKEGAGQLCQREMGNRLKGAGEGNEVWRAA